MSKTCFTCKIEQLSAEFHKEAQHSDGLSSYCKTCRKSQRQSRYLKNKEKEYQNANKWRSQNREKAIQIAVKSNRKARETNPKAKLRHNIRNRIKRAINLNFKSGSTLKLLGCTVDFLKSYLESKFVKGMTWENYGKWHIDHIIPLSAFNLSDLEQIRTACNFKNLQPLWAEDNLKKSNKVLNF